MFHASYTEKGGMWEVIKLKKVTLVLIDYRTKYPTQLDVFRIKTVTNTTGVKVEVHNVFS
jgi:hypothetical protein